MSLLFVFGTLYISGANISSKHRSIRRLITKSLLVDMLRVSFHSHKQFSIIFPTGRNFLEIIHFTVSLGFQTSMERQQIVFVCGIIQDKVTQKRQMNISSLVVHAKMEDHGQPLVKQNRPNIDHVIIMNKRLLPLRDLIIHEPCYTG